VATLSINPTTSGTLTVTATAKNYKYYQGSVTVASGGSTPEIIDINPKCGPEAGGWTLTITGENFTSVPVMWVQVGALYSPNVNVLNSTTLTFTAPPLTNGWYDVRVGNAYGTDTVAAGYRAFPLTTNPFNATDIVSSPLTPPCTATLIVSGNAGTPFMAFYSFGTGPTATPYGTMGLSMPVYLLLSGVIGPGASYTFTPLALPSGYGPLDLYIHVLGYDGAGYLKWAFGGYNPGGYGSIWFHLNN